MRKIMRASWRLLRLVLCLGALLYASGAAAQNWFSPLTASTASSTQINLSWPLVWPSDFSNTLIYRNGSLIAGMDSYTSSFSDTGLAPSTTYTYQVYVCSQEGCF